MTGWRQQVAEKLNMKNADMGEVVKDFYASDAPQFKGKSKKKRQQMAIAAKLQAEAAAWTKKSGKNSEGGLNEKGRKSYEAENPGSDLKAPVTDKPSTLDPDSKKAKRRKSFCARMGGMEGPLKDEKGKPTRKKLALDKWNC